MHGFRAAGRSRQPAGPQGGRLDLRAPENPPGLRPGRRDRAGLRPHRPRGPTRRRRAVPGSAMRSCTSTRATTRVATRPPSGCTWSRASPPTARSWEPRGSAAPVRASESTSSRAGARVRPALRLREGPGAMLGFVAQNVLDATMAQWQAQDLHRAWQPLSSWMCGRDPNMARAASTVHRLPPDRGRRPRHRGCRQHHRSHCLLIQRTGRRQNRSCVQKGHDSQRLLHRHESTRHDRAGGVHTGRIRI